MKRFTAAAFALLLLTAAFAQEKTDIFTVALEASSYLYKEPGDHPVKMPGRMYGASAEYMHGGMGKHGRSFIALDLLYMQGSVDYDGWYRDLNTGTYTKADASGIDNYYLESRFKFGGAFNPSDNLKLSPYTGLGGRYLVNSLGAKPGGYDRTSLYVYIPLGLKTDLMLPHGWGLGFYAEYDWLLMGKQRSKMSDVNPLWNNLTNDQSKGYGIKLSVRAKKDLKKMGIFAEPFFRYWNIQESDESVLITPGYTPDRRIMVEPKNETHEWGLRAGIYF